MKKMLFFLTVVLLLLLAGCGERSPRPGGLLSSATTVIDEYASMQASLSEYAAQITGEAGFRKGYTYIGPEETLYDGRIFIHFKALSSRRRAVAVEGMVFLGEITSTVDGTPQNDFESSRDLDPGTRLYMLPGSAAYIVALPPGEELVFGETYRLVYEDRTLYEEPPPAILD